MNIVEAVAPPQRRAPITENPSIASGLEAELGTVDAIGDTDSMSYELDGKGKPLPFKGREQVKFGTINIINDTNSSKIGIEIISQN